MSKNIIPIIGFLIALFIVSIALIFDIPARLSTFENIIVILLLLIAGLTFNKLMTKIIQKKDRN